MAPLRRWTRAGIFAAFGFTAFALVQVFSPLDASAAEKKKPAHTHPASEAANNDPTTIHQTGDATWYGSTRKKKMIKTSSGERFDPTLLTAAHATLPLQSSVKVTNLENGQSVVVRINDRLPHHRRRIIDVTPTAAEVLGFKRDGVVRVALAAATVEAPKTEAAPSTPPTPAPPPPTQPAAPAPKWEPAGASPY